MMSLKDEPNLLEGDVRKWMRSHWPGWIDWREPGKGLGAGAPDCEVLAGRVILPLELKAGAWEGALLKPHRVRPAQVGWHTSINSWGGRTGLVIGCRSLAKGLEILLVSGRHVRKWQDGFEWHQIQRLWPLDNPASLQEVIRLWVCVEP